MTEQRPLVSIVVPLLDEEENLPHLFEAMEAMFRENPAYRYEVVAVDDGSRDGSLELLKQQAGKVDYLRVISLSRNFGSHAALLAGMRAARGDAVTYLSADLQDPPSLVPRLVEPWAQGSAEIVWAVRSGRRDPLLTRLLSWFAHTLFRLLTGLEIPREGVELSLVDQKVIRAVCSQSWRNCSVAMALYWSGYRRTTVLYERAERLHGRSKWSLGRRIRLFVDTTAGFSCLPMRLMSLTGGLVSLAGFAYAGLIAYRALTMEAAVAGWASTMVVLLVVGGLILISNGVLGEYLWRTLEEARGRPMYLVRETWPQPAGQAEEKAQVSAPDQPGGGVQEVTSP